jgi:hypothetical protein
MKYLCLVYYRESDIEAMGQRQWDALNQECITCGEGLRASGHMLDGSALEPTSTATTVRVRDGRIAITDGPFAETKEQLVGFYLVEARDLNDAIRVAGKIPPARFGSIEVRPVRELRAANNSGPGM